MMPFLISYCLAHTTKCDDNTKLCIRNSDTILKHSTSVKTTACNTVDINSRPDQHIPTDFPALVMFLKRFQLIITELQL